MGHGKSSSTPVDGYPFDELVPELLELVDTVYKESKIPPEKKFFVVGHSMGACCAIEMAACPEVRDRIEAIAPMSGPCDFWNPSMTKQDRKATGTMAFLYNSQKKGCCGAINRWMLKKMSSMALSKPNKDYGMAAYYMNKEQQRQGAKPSWDAIDNNPFYATLCLDTVIPGCVTVHDGVNEFRRAMGAPWSYDPREVKVPCFIYNGNPEETTVKNAESNHKMIQGSELIVMEGHGHMSILMESGRIIQALVKKEKVESPCWAK
jgi:pimeloyl-ACP methyl ester carboxylesterase